ncbi:MAG: ribosome-binding factor A [Patescibacteria group bacterium]|nr:ribosome-binding factor A [Patescibacteria group bacterium]
MSRMEQVNAMLQAELAQLINECVEFRDGLITITRVKCSPNLKEATVFVSVLPENKYGSALKALRKSDYNFSKYLKKRIKMKYIPRFNWQIDSTEKEADELEKIIINMNKYNGRKV